MLSFYLSTSKFCVNICVYYVFTVLIRTDRAHVLDILFSFFILRGHSQRVRLGSRESPPLTIPYRFTFDIMEHTYICIKSKLPILPRTDLLQRGVYLRVSVRLFRVQVVAQSGREQRGALRQRAEPRAPAPQAGLRRGHAVHCYTPGDFT